MRKIAITGPECSGKTTLCNALAGHYQCPWIEEYAREYLSKTKGIYRQNDLDTIAKTQFEAFTSASENHYLFVDTEMLVMKIWSEEKYGNCSSIINKLLKKQKFEFYFLCKPNIPFQEDPLRENPNNRLILFELYQQALTQNQFPFVVVEGTKQERLEKCIALLQ